MSDPFFSLLSTSDQTKFPKSLPYSDYLSFTRHFGYHLLLPQFKVPSLFQETQVLPKTPSLPFPVYYSLPLGKYSIPTNLLPSQALGVFTESFHAVILPDWPQSEFPDDGIVVLLWTSCSSLHH